MNEVATGTEKKLNQKEEYRNLYRNIYTAQYKRGNIYVPG